MMRFFNSEKIKQAASRALSFSTLYLGTGVIINALGPILGSLYGFLIVKKDSEKHHCHYITKGSELAKLYYYPLTATYNKLTKMTQENSSDPKEPSPK